jgi:hypothetical protein
MTLLPRSFCSDCKKTVKNGQAIYSLTGEHYECYKRREKAGRKFEKVLWDTKWIPKEDKLEGAGATGWLSPEGKFYSCPSYVHIALGAALARYFYGKGNDECTLEEKGWGHVSGIGFHTRYYGNFDREKATQAQLEVLVDWFLTVKEGTRLHTFLKWLLRPGESDG